MLKVVTNLNISKDRLIDIWGGGGGVDTLILSKIELFELT